MPRRSAGLLLYRVGAAGELEVLVVHPGGPLWTAKDAGAWSIPKGEYADDEDAAAVAAREFDEELGTPAPSGPWLDLGEVVQGGGKRVRAWAAEGDLDASAAVSNTFDLEWPPHSGTTVSFPEVDRAAWATIADAREKLNAGQVALLDRLLGALGRPG